MSLLVRPTAPPRWLGLDALPDARLVLETIVPIWQFQRPTRRSPCRAWRTMASVKSSGCCWRTRCEGITLPTPGGMTGLDPSGEEGLGRGVLVG
jgi:hypothetical protein